MQMQNFSLAEIGLIIIAIFGLYLLPSLISFLRRNKNWLAIFLLNLFLGWTGIGWVVALVWSVIR
ncbi:MAG: superinfection immunity protein [Candidatus Omnitrophota bacterium]|nr:superinfection immunity protein [Candidatus Omnitrophota bacterium]